MEKITKIWIWVVAVIGAVAIVAVILLNVQTIKQTTNGENSIQSAQDISAQDVGVAAAPISYNQALIKYADRRIQLDKTCQA